MAQIIIIEDSHLLRVRVSDILREHGYEDIKAFESASDIIKNPEKYLENTSLIITDIELPEVSGMILTRQLKTSSKFSNIPIIIMSCNNDLETVKEAISLGVADYIAKPFKDKLFISKVKSIIGEARTEQVEENITSLAERELIADIIDKEHSRAIRGQYPFVIVRLSTKSDNLTKLKSNIYNKLRRIDSVHIIDGEIIIILIATDENGLETVINRITKETQGHELTVKSSVCFEPDSDTTLENILEAVFK